jgi:hypothetical protein
MLSSPSSSIGMTDVTLPNPHTAKLQTGFSGSSLTNMNSALKKSTPRLTTATFPCRSAVSMAVGAATT